MAYKAGVEASLVISRQHHTMLKTLAERNKRKLRAMTETLIEEAYKGKKK